MLNLDTLSEEEFVEELRRNYFLPAQLGTLEERIKIIYILMDYFKMDRNREQLAFILCNYPRIIAEACAGAGKTTSCILKILVHSLFKDIDANHTIMLTYTTDATSDLRYKLDKAYTLINQLEFSTLEITGKVQVKTIHSFFTDLIYEYADTLGIKIVNRKLAVLSNSESQNYMKNVLDALTEKDVIHFNMFDSLPKMLLDLYSQIKERDIYDEKELWCRCSNFKELQTLDFNELVAVYEGYEKFKRGTLVIEFCEYAKLCQKLLSVEKIRDRWRRLYSCITLDEYQDVTESQVNVFKLLMLGAEDCRLVAIGDGDQSIYGFRGAHANGCVNFKDEFSVDGQKVAVCTMSLNRRCPQIVLGKAKQIIETITKRLDKNLSTNIDGGSFQIVTTLDYRDETAKVIKHISEMDSNELGNTVIAYRANKSARYIKRKLEDEGIRVKINSEVRDPFETTIVGALNMLNDPYNLNLASQNLFKMVPKGRGFGKYEINEVINKERLRRKEGYQTKTIFELDFTETSAPKSFFNAMTTLYQISRATMNEKFTKQYLTRMKYFVTVLITDFLIKYYLEWQSNKADTEGFESLLNEEGKFLDEYSAYIYEMYTQDITYPEFKARQTKREEKLDNSLREINMSTFHGLKGLEYKNVFLIDLRDSVFPGYELAQATKFGGNFIEMADDEAKRLLYVAMTRAKQNLYMCFRAEGPSRYLSYLQEDVFKETDEFDSFFNDNTMDSLPIVDNTSEFLVNSDGKLLKKASALDRWLNNDS